MTPVEQKGGITRRSFFQGTAKAVAGAGALTAVNSITATSAGVRESSSSGPGSMAGKIALEEHFDFAATLKSSYAAFGGPEFQRQIQDLSSGRIAEMDRGGVEVCIVSLVGPGIQAIPNPSQAVEVARRANDHLAENIAKNPKRLKGFAALALQDPQSAAQELTRCIKELGFCGALVNGLRRTTMRIRSCFTTCHNIVISGRRSNSLMSLFTFIRDRLYWHINWLTRDIHG